MIDIEKCRAGAEYICKKTDLRPKVAIILGSGLGELTKQLSSPVKIKYTDIPGFAKCTNKAHEGALYVGKLDGVPAALFSGRYHYYEGHGFDVMGNVIGTMKFAGIEKLVITNAVGAINPAYAIGDFVLIKDHIKLTAESPVRGNDDSKLGARFFDMSDAYSKELREKVKASAEAVGESMREGVYFFASGPQYETPAEIRAFSLLGGDVVGMSCVPEAIAAAYCGIKTVGVSCVTNMAAGISKNKLSDADVIDVTTKMSERFKKLIIRIVKDIDAV